MNNIKYLLAVLALAIAAAPAAAQDKPAPVKKTIYFGGSGGRSVYSETCEVQAITPCDDTDFGWRAFAGYEFNRRLAVEAGFADLGAVESAGTEIRSVLASDISGLLHFPVLGNGTVFGRVGLFRARTKVGGAVEVNAAWTYGAGVSYNLGLIGFRVEWQTWNNVGGGATGEDNANLFSVGGMLRF
jgi:OmpA-OmpF porin, OOP family